MSYRLAIRRDTAANWTSVNPILGQGEFGLEYDTNRLKIGDGDSAWIALPYYTGVDEQTIMSSFDLTTVDQITVGGNGTVSGNLAVGGSTSIGGSLSVGGTITGVTDLTGVNLTATADLQADTSTIVTLNNTTLHGDVINATTVNTTTLNVADINGTADWETTGDVASATAITGIQTVDTHINVGGTLGPRILSGSGNPNERS